MKWKTGLSCRSRTAIIGKQVNIGLEISMNDTRDEPINRYGR